MSAILPPLIYLVFIKPWNATFVINLHLIIFNLYYNACNYYRLQKCKINIILYAIVFQIYYYGIIFYCNVILILYWYINYKTINKIKYRRITGKYECVRKARKETENENTCKKPASPMLCKRPAGLLFIDSVFLCRSLFAYLCLSHIKFCSHFH